MHPKLLVSIVVVFFAASCADSSPLDPLDSVPPHSRATGSAHPTKDDYSRVKSESCEDRTCTQCLDMDHCMYIKATTVPEDPEVTKPVVVFKCVLRTNGEIDADKIKSEDFDKYTVSDLEILTSSKLCPAEEEQEDTEETTLADDNATTSTTTLTTSPEGNTTTTTVGPDNTTTTTAVVNTTTTTEAPTTTTTANMTTTPMMNSTTTSTTPVTPEPKSGNHFDGWSFFGGILLTLGLFAIGMVSMKYYKARSASGSGSNYNRF